MKKTWAIFVGIVFGIIFVIIGLAYDNPVIWILGLCLLLIEMTLKFPKDGK
jgi:4-hydroxybenzoate polyprenyltransferase